MSVGQGERPCEASFFDRTLCFCHSTGIMHTYVCEMPGGHEGDHAGRGDGCSRASWTNRDDGPSDHRQSVPEAVIEAAPKNLRELAALVAERDDLRATGDTLQSSASRMAEWILTLVPVSPAFVPYEVHMAALEAQTAVEQWTEIRRNA